MPDGTLPEPGPDEEPGGFSRDPDRDPDRSPDPDPEADAEQGLFVCLPAEELTLAGFAQDGRADTMAPGALLAVVLDTVTGEQGEGLPQLSEDQLIGVISAARRFEARMAWTQLAATAEFAARRRGSEFAADELSAEFRQPWPAAAEQIRYATAVAGRLPEMFAALARGRVHPVHVKIVEDETRYLSAEDAAAADKILAGAAQDKSFGQLRYAAHRLVLKLDPEAAARRKEAARADAHVRPFREDSGNAGMVARELPSDEVLASWQHVEQRALDLRAAGVPGTLRELRVRAYLDLLQERDTRLHAQDPAAAGGAERDPAAPGGPGLAALVTITIPWSTLAGRGDAPADIAGFGLLDAVGARSVTDAAARHPSTRWCLTVLGPDGTAAAHGCGHGRPPWASGPHRALKLILNTVIRGPCDHAQAERHYQPSRQLRHLINVRNTRCTAPGCPRPAARCDLDHTTAWDHGGATCPCNLAPLCRHHHRAKQAQGWRLEQPEPGVLRWRTPSGRRYATTPTVYPVW